MSWFDGSFDHSPAELEENYPVKVTDGLRLTADGKRMALINSFERGTALFELSDPKAEDDQEGDRVFYHVFLGEDSEAAKKAVNSFVLTADLKDCGSVVLLRKEADRIFEYSNGYI